MAKFAINGELITPMRLKKRALMILIASAIASSACAKSRADCGMRTSDWCTQAGSDPCGAHESEASCRKDPRCVGEPYRGESVVACEPDGHGFWKNCPATGCVSKPRAK